MKHMMSASFGTVRRFLRRFAHRGRPGSYDGPHADDPWRTPTRSASYGQGPREHSVRTHGTIAGNSHRAQNPSHTGWLR